MALTRHEQYLRLKAAVLSCYAHAEHYYLKSFPRPEVLCNLRGRAAGMAELQRNRLRFNPVLLEENEAAFLQEVVPHEVAHLLAWQLHGRGIRPHGAEWQQIMRQVFGLAAERTHDFDVRRSARQAWIYACGCVDREHALTIRRHNRILRGHAYVCLQCRTRLTYVRLDESVTET
ncbi:SprT family zinc-dependent metalloprotease [Marinospirillum alkaliphilum]|uniref:SprT family zinc-dependent metalloprotease n=1 Tax=Marinospirillum alkaliphilum TaxID=148454 RepID=UPI000930FAC4|nr:SprT family zinc-dependent metalloprotease [Marinospirillum alkaliphilum]